MLIDKGIELYSWIYYSDFSLKIYIHGDKFCQGVNLEGVELSLVSSIEHLKGLTLWLSCYLSIWKDLHFD